MMNVLGSSMSRNGSCLNNAVLGLFFGLLKVELNFAENYRMVEVARAGIFEYIEGFYNRCRGHSAIRYVSPHVYEQQFKQITVSMIRG